MPDRQFGSNSDQIQENDYFRRQDQDLIQALRRKAAKESEIATLMQEFGIRESELVCELAELGFNRETLRLLHLVPLIQVAWADGSVSQRERDEILEIAQLRGVQAGTAAYERLVSWLEQKPRPHFFAVCVRGIQVLLRHQTSIESAHKAHDLVSYCTRVALASGGFFGLGTRISEQEQRLLAKFARDMEVRHPSGSQQTVGELRPGGKLAT